MADDFIRVGVNRRGHETDVIRKSGKKVIFHVRIQRK